MGLPLYMTDMIVVFSKIGGGWSLCDVDSDANPSGLLINFS
jgi:hypothetical protein